ncbi:hypothetical protein K445DRAFT_14000 [Daldinia sp. EC12]|nr:hypothetical protein K445DRAFT_14000 [Daldinia sp. EC12]
MKYSVLTVLATFALSVTAAPIRNSQAEVPDCVSTQSCADGIHAPADKRRTNQEIIDEAKRLQKEAVQNVPDCVSTQSCADGIHAPADKRRTNEEIIEEAGGLQEEAA